MVLYKEYKLMVALQKAAAGENFEVYFITVYDLQHVLAHLNRSRWSAFSSILPCQSFVHPLHFENFALHTMPSQS